MQRLHTTRQGISQDDARNRLDAVGANEITEQTINPICKFLGY